MDELTLVTWNVNSLRAREQHVLRFLVEWRPDVLCLQETKVADEEFPRAGIEALGYEAAIWGQKTYNGVAILSRVGLADVRTGFDTGSGGDRDEDGTGRRLIAATAGGLRVLNAYVPNGGAVGSDKFADKLAFLERLREHLAGAHRPSDPLVLVGDLNVAPEPRDVWDPEAMDGQTCYHPAERERLASLRDWGFRDAFRAVEDGAGFYSWWDYRQGAWSRNMGLRIDHIWITAPLRERLRDCWIERGERGRDRASDHVPVLAAFATGA